MTQLDKLTSEATGYTFQQWRPQSLTFSLGHEKGQFSIKATAEGFDVEVPDGVTMTECAEAFVNGLRGYLKELKV